VVVLCADFGDVRVQTFLEPSSASTWGHDSASVVELYAVCWLWRSVGFVFAAQVRAQAISCLQTLCLRCCGCTAW
jgi:hypothetical protein